MALKIPVIRGVIERRILVNYRVDAEVLAKALPAPFRPKLVSGMGLAGICLIRLKQVRPRLWPAWLGISSENAAHRVAVEWDENGRAREGVYVSRRDTNSRLNALAGGRLFPGVHYRADFSIDESNRKYGIRINSHDGQVGVSLQAELAERLPAASVFGSTQAAAEFFERGSLGYSATADGQRFQGLELRCQRWQMEPLDVREVRSSFFDDEGLFPRGSIAFDSALLMREIEHEWRAMKDLCAGG